ncbi:unnamed protein product [Rotaria magnacalcarata]|uniref:BTB domain-containing protein n=2 Tax=Rotaria magnacalcarata TaxID=392030 RepID=A0A816CRG5_9BILA|nr:unnamed protein product [Rotaria magnacalcarata]CAF1626780.1 unnamed protein product [Rotaria magnacalcarata]CAF2061941.1 unnamed protein product [Rotaria magnacalcarata]CAF2098585.1 unnamed protein product [Rotaria magnacalcarata]CAF3755514.1 unnamed protein product [Rotaria magnacalcarata]
MNPSNDQLSSLEQKSFRKKFIRRKLEPNKGKNDIPNPIKNQQKRISEFLIAARDSFIQVKKQYYSSSSTKTKGDKEHDRITINISGKRYQTYLSIFENYPNTLLGNKQKRMDYWNEQENEYFFDRHRACFEAILYYYQSNGRLRRPDYVPLDTFLEEVSFFDLGPQAISQIDKSENVSIVKYIQLPNWFWRRYTWFYLEYPQHSIFGRILHFNSMLLTVLSCVSLAVETLPKYNQQYNVCENKSNVSLNTTDVPLCSENFSSPFFIIQTICVSYFTIEFILRLLSAPSYNKFVLSIYNWVDLSAIIPYFVILGLELSHQKSEVDASLISGLRVFRILRFLRLIKIYLIFTQLKSFRVLSATLKESFLDFIIFIIILALLAFLFGTGTYFAEESSNGQMFDSIPKATYWGIITITTVGYGDMYPTTVIGRILACTCAYFGVATSGILVSILVDRYQRVYNRKRFFPDHVISAIDPCESEHDEKQDFINRKLSETKNVLSNKENLAPASTPSIYLSIKNKKSLRHNRSAVPVRLIISFTDNEMNEKSMDRIANEIMEELTDEVKNSEYKIKFKLIKRKTDHLHNEMTT